ncbi:MAG: MmcQ/YjbR family DNA-binding protein [Clostridia bacterium]|nr:MmcQ/YjbR family DNA-binding protein [Clostridia bacterium]
MAEINFKNKRLIKSKLIPFGFERKPNGYVYSREIARGQFLMTVTILDDGKVSSKVEDISSGEEYVLHLTPKSTGTYVGKVKQDYETVLEDIAMHCYKLDVFQSDYAHHVISYVQNTYGDELEFLWERFPNNAIWRRKDNAKWYGVLAVLSKQKLGLDLDENVDIIDLKMDKYEIKKLVDNKKYFPGYHMNKNNWYTICLDGSVNIEEIYRRIDESYRLAKNK